MTRQTRQEVIECNINKRQRPNFGYWKHDSVLIQFERLYTRGNLLEHSRNIQSAHPDYAVSIPQATIPNILKGMYDSLSCGHLGITRTEERTRKRFCWPRIRQSVKDHVGQCFACHQRHENY